jgi:AP-1 complex subunit gamma-1
VRIVRKVPDLVEYLTVPATGLLTDKHHGVLVSGVKLCTELCQSNELALEHFRKVCV